MWAHMHTSFNWIIYYFTNTIFEAAFNQIAHMDSCFGICRKTNDDETSTEEGNTSDILLIKPKSIDS